ncbi:hypothetical protein INT48_008113 [Thamnidium elegans]|uniref:CAP-Gly domain-containing protein n=1 Tax=Thamnidium elegans TaxID=101142 RepID=A0A8H7SVV8_9FUNG|nr:hypothetical protein INT48_008113 [Thamnidium elegans]
MFERPTKTLKHSLFNVLENAQEYVADVSLLLTRVPELFINQYIPQLNTKQESPISLDISVVIPYTTLRQLLRFWYIADFSAPLDEASLLSSRVSGLSLKDASYALQSEVETNIRKEIDQLQQKLAVPLLVATDNKSTDNEQWISDLKKMMDQKIATDVVVNIFNVPSSTKVSTTAESVSFPAHRFILASQSPYFYSVFCTEFREASTSSVHMPSDLFSESSLQVILYYFYTDTLILPTSTSSNKLNSKKHELRILQKVFTAADFLGHFNTICKAVLVKIAIICHQFKCVCSDCSILLPSMLLFADKNEKYVPKLRSKLISLYADPLDSLAPLWSQKPFAILVNSMTNINTSTSKPTTSTTINDGAQVISQIFNSKVTVPSPAVIVPPTDNSSPSLNSFTTTTEPTLITEITDRTFENITKHNSVRVLHSLHLCLSYIRGADPFPTWSQPTLNILNQFLHHTVDMISTSFDYYCVEYPILLSCVDGIGFGFSVDFLGFVLNRVLTDGIHDGNAAILYQGIVRDLGGRQEMVRNVAVDSVLLDARVKCAQYISKRWTWVKEAVNLSKLNLYIYIDINVPMRNLTKPMENDFSSTIFSFKPKKTPHTPVAKAVLSNDVKRTSQEESSSKTYPKIVGRTRSLSASIASPDLVVTKRDTASHHSDSEERVTVSAIRRKSGTMPTYRSFKRNGSTGSLTDALLPIELPKELKQEKEKDTPRPTRLRFALPDTPSRVSKNARLTVNNGLNMAHISSARKKKRAKSPGKSRWSIGYNTSDSSDDEGPKKNLAAVGQKVELLRRPLPTQGTIKYIGDVDFAKGVWVGVELESRLGNNDGSVDGKRYFQTFPQRGVFVKIDDFKIISPEKK